MKLVYLKRAILMVFSLILLIGCNKIDENVHGGVVPPQKIAEAFNSLYPNTDRPIWRVDNNYYIIRFTYNLLENTVWLTAQGDFTMQQTVLPETYIPVLVTDAFQKSIYSDYSLISADSVVRAEMTTLYRLEVKSSTQKLNLYYTNNGELVKVIDTADDALNPIIVPAPVLAFLAKDYPEAQLLFIEQNANGYNLILLIDQQIKEIQFNT